MLADQPFASHIVAQIDYGRRYAHVADGVPEPRKQAGWIIVLALEQRPDRQTDIVAISRRILDHQFSELRSASGCRSAAITCNS